jgi:hypothetical protein
MEALSVHGMNGLEVAAKGCLSKELLWRDWVLVERISLTLVKALARYNSRSRNTQGIATYYV